MLDVTALGTTIRVWCLFEVEDTGLDLTRGVYEIDDSSANPQTIFDEPGLGRAYVEEV